ncbi:acyl carrier protein [Kitasatospora sp. NPDC097691]|uniref:acyl carrier protein n=1 Tax=Kitasatospora sp. NPDC097691 TaxID=3157231 RepID=UPI0033234650
MSDTEVTGILDAERKALVKQIVCDVLEVEPAELGEADDFVEQHEADSLAGLTILATLERDLHIELAQEELERMTNLAGVYAVVAEAESR